MKSSRFTVPELVPQALDAPDHFNDWYFTLHFEHAGRPHVLKLSITEGTLLGQMTGLTLSREGLHTRDEDDATVLLPPQGADLQLEEHDDPMLWEQAGDEVRVTMGTLTAICRPEEQRIIARHPRLQADLTYRPRGPILHWEHEAGAVAQVTEITRVSGSESMSEVEGTLTLDGETVPVQGRGVFEHVWFSALNFFEIRHMNWIYAHFDELYVYLCHCESVTSESQPFHFETGEMVLGFNDQQWLPVTYLEVEPLSWIYLQAARRFVPLEQAVIARTEVGTLHLTTRMAHYPLMIHGGAVRLEGLTVDRVPGWQSLFYDAPIVLEGYFKASDGRRIPLTHGVGMNELIRISAL